MQIQTLLRYLIGQRQAIEQVATNPSTLLIGFLFVIAAGFAREYDHESLLHESWHVLIPLAASSALALVFYSTFFILNRSEATLKPAFFAGYVRFLGMFWMIAPLALLYAMPYERMLDAGAATEMNLWTLALVACWRVLLITRVISVLLNISFIPTFMIVMLISDVAALIALALVPLPIINFMGGVSLSQSEQLISSAAFSIQILGVLSLPIWILGSLIAIAPIANVRTDWQLFHSSPISSDAGWLKRAALACIAIGLAALPLTQPEQVRRHRAESLLRSGAPGKALAYMSSFEEGDFPPHWDPPPRPGYGERQPQLQQIAEAIDQQPVAEWVRAAYARKLEDDIHRDVLHFHRFATWEQFAEHVRERTSEAEFEALRPRLELLLRINPHLNQADRVAIAALLEWKPAKAGDSAEASQHSRL